MTLLDEDSDQARRRTAEAWLAKLGQPRGDPEDLQAFSAWRRDPDNHRVWEDLQAARRRLDRFVVRPETGRFRVVDIWTGQTAVIAVTTG